MLRKLFLRQHRQMGEVQGRMITFDESTAILVHKLKAETRQLEMPRFVEFNGPHARIGGLGGIEADAHNKAISQRLLLSCSGEPLWFRIGEFLDIEVRVFALWTSIRFDFLEHGFTRQWMLVDPKFERSCTTSREKSLVHSVVPPKTIELFYYFIIHN